MIRERLGANDANYTLQKMAIDRPNEHAPHVKKFLVSAQPEVRKKRRKRDDSTTSPVGNVCTIT